MKSNAWLTYSEEEMKQVMEFAEQYRVFLSNCKTERECTSEIIEEAKKAGFKEISECINKGITLKPGDGVYADCMGKALCLFRIGTLPMEQGMNILGAHIDSPRLDLKQNPLYEESEQALLDTHYYGGIKKYQWVTLPLALHGVVVRKDGSKVSIVIGEKPEDPVVCVTDLLIHLAGEQMEKKARVVIEGENLDILIGSRPVNTEGEEAEQEKESKEGIKKKILEILKEQYQIEEDDFISAEIEAVPAGPARDCGLDRSMILGYGHDDRVCAYASAEAFLEMTQTEKTAVCLLVDKEEIGSVGATGMQSRFFENTVAEIMNLTGTYSELLVRRCLANSRMLSSDVSAAVDANYVAAFEKKNAAFLGHGLVFNKYTGSRGKSGSNDASAEYMALVRNCMDEAKVTWQTAELGKVDVGGGGTIAYITGNYGMEVIDSGVAVLSMHAPWEVISKADLYESKKGYAAFLNHL